MRGVGNAGSSSERRASRSHLTARVHGRGDYTLRKTAGTARTHPEIRLVGSHFMSCTSADFAYLRSIVLEESANVLDESRDYLFQSRLQNLLMSSGLMTLDRLVAALRLQLDPGLGCRVAEAMTIKETSFFRDRSPFELLQQELLPGIIRRRESVRRLRLWSAA